MTLPAAFAKSGYLDPAIVRKSRRLMLGSDGPPDSGKTEFALSAPGPLLWLALDRGIDGVLDNSKPPATRTKQMAIKVVRVPKATQLGSKEQYLEYWRAFYGDFAAGLDMAECRTLLLDGDSDSWELQRLAEFGKLHQVPSNLYTNVNAARRAMYARAYDAGKIVIATNKIKKVYVTKFRADGKPELTESGKEVREWNGEYSRQGFDDQEYLWGIQLRHMNRITPAGVEFGVKLTKCKADKDLEGYELWGDSCNFASLVQTVYPQYDLKAWGY